jgi:peptide deformylase
LHRISPSFPHLNYMQAVTPAENAISVKDITAPYLGEEFLPTAKKNYLPNCSPDGSGCYPYPVWVYGAEVLTQKANDIPLSWGGQLTYNLAQVLAQTLCCTGDGTAIAANQVGVLWRMFIVETSNFTGDVLVHSANPTTPPPSQPGQPVSTGQPAPSMVLPQFPFPENNGNYYYIFINPVVTPVAPLGAIDNVWQSNEGCLSIPHYPGNVQGCTGEDQASVLTPRYKQFTLQFYTLIPGATAKDSPTLSDLLLYTSTFDASGNPADNPANNPNWILQHETDHLNGVLYTQISTGMNVPGTGNNAYLNQIGQGGQGGVYNPNYVLLPIPPQPVTPQPPAPHPGPRHPVPAA